MILQKDDLLSKKKREFKTEKKKKKSSNTDLMDQWRIIEEILVSPIAFKASPFQTTKRQ